MYVYYQDTDSSQWVAITVSTSILDGSIDTLKPANDSVTALKVADDLLTSSGSTFPSPTLEGQLHYNTGDGRLYIAVQNAGATLIWVDASPAINPQTATLQETTDSGSVTTTDITVANVTSTGQINAKNTAKAWVNFNSVGTVTIRDSFNVSSVTDNATGDFTINFATPMSNSNYSVTSLSQYDQSGATAGGAIWSTIARLSNALTIDGVRIYVETTNGTLYDVTTTTVTVFSN